MIWLMARSQMETSKSPKGRQKAFSPRYKNNADCAQGDIADAREKNIAAAVMTS
jgi:hypothetical protein